MQNLINSNHIMKHELDFNSNGLFNFHTITEAVCLQICEVIDNDY